jgi:hypothetical protein
LPFVLDVKTRFYVIPWLDSLNETDDDSNRRSHDVEYFPLWFRVVIWIFIGLFGSILWSVIIPFVLSLPLWIGRIGTSWGLNSTLTADNVWQYGWFILFMLLG